MASNSWRTGQDYIVLIRDRLIWKPYYQKPKLYLKYYWVSQLKRFRRYIEREFKWDDGHFLIKDIETGKPYARFEIYDGRMRVLHKIDKKGMLYGVFRYFKV